MTIQPLQNPEGKTTPQAEQTKQGVKPLAKTEYEPVNQDEKVTETSMNKNKGDYMFLRPSKSEINNQNIKMRNR